MAIYYGDGSNSTNGRAIASGQDYGTNSRYTINSGSWHEVDSSFRCAVTPRSTGNILRCTIFINPVLNGGEFGGIIPVIHNSVIGNRALHDDSSPSGNHIVAANVLGDNSAMNEMFRHNASYLFWPCQISGHFSVANSGITHTLKMFAQMGSGDIVIGDNTCQSFMQIEEFESS